MEVAELDRLPNEEDGGVQNIVRGLEDKLQLRGIITMTESAARYLYVSCNAAATDSTQLIKIQECLFSTIKLCDACSLMMQNFQSGANNILEKLKIAYLYLLDGFPDFAMADIEAISKDVDAMQEAANKHLMSEQDTLKKTEEANDSVKSVLMEMQLSSRQKREEADAKREKIRKLEPDGRIHGSPNETYDPRSGSEIHGERSGLSVLFICTLILVSAQYYFQKEICEYAEPYLGKDCQHCPQIHVSLGLAILVVLLIMWISDTTSQNKGNALIVCVICILVYSTNVNAVQQARIGTCEKRSTVSYQEGGNLSLASDGNFSNNRSTVAYQEGGNLSLASDGNFTNSDERDAGQEHPGDAGTKRDGDEDVSQALIRMYYVLLILKTTACTILAPLAYYHVKQLDIKDSFISPTILIIHIGVSVSLLLPEPVEAFAVPVCTLVVVSVCTSVLLLAYTIWFRQPSSEEDNSDPVDTEANLRRLKLELEDSERDLNAIESKGANMELSNLLMNHTTPYLLGIEAVLNEAVTLVKEWYKECKNVVEPNMGVNISKVANMDKADRSKYWNSLQFKSEVVGYYCRWRALEVYCQENRKFVRTTRRTIEGYYTENLYPREAVAKAWQQAAEIEEDDVKMLVNKHLEYEH